MATFTQNEYKRKPSDYPLERKTEQKTNNNNPKCKRQRKKF